MFSAVMVADSVCNGIRLSTMQLCYPRFIHAEFMTHRVFSRNASSSRAIPVKRMLEAVRSEPAMPIHWGKNQPGMQADEQHDAVVRVVAGDNHVEMSVQEAWWMAAHNAARIAEAMDEAGYHKQVVNRILEPFQHMNVVVSSTTWDNFFALRDHEMAQPEIRALAVQMKIAMHGSKPEYKQEGDWHTPYVLERESSLDQDTKNKISAARCARVSYKTFEGKNPKVEEDLKLYERLAGAMPAHLSPLEHVASAQSPTERYGNFLGWKQLRQYHEEGSL